MAAKNQTKTPAEKAQDVVDKQTKLVDKLSDRLEAAKELVADLEPQLTYEQALLVGYRQHPALQPAPGEVDDYPAGELPRLDDALRDQAFEEPTFTEVQEEPAAGPAPKIIGASTPSFNDEEPPAPPAAEPEQPQPVASSATPFTL